MFRKPLFYFAIAAVCLLAGIISFAWWEQENYTAKLSTQITQDLEEEIRLSNLIAEDLIGKEKDLAWKPSGENEFFLFTDGRISKWSTNEFVPELFWIGEPGKWKFVNSLRGSFLTRSQKVDTNQTLVAVIPLMERFRITNRYLSPKWNNQIFPEGVSLIIGADLKDSFPVMFEGSKLFDIQLSQRQPFHGGFSFFFITLSICVVMMGLLMVVLDAHKERKYERTLLLLVLVPGAIRIVMIETGFPASWSLSPIFESSGFASSAFNPSIGDLFFNSLYVLIPCAYFFFYFFRFSFIGWVLNRKGILRVLLSVLILLAAFLGFLFPFLYFETVFHNSAVTLDWTQSLDFDALRVVAFLSVMIGSLCSFLFCHACISLSIRLAGKKRLFGFLAVVPAAAFLFFLYALFSDRDYNITLLVAPVYFLILYFTGWQRSLMQTSYVTFLYLVFAVLCYAMQGSLSIKKFTIERTVEFQNRFGMNFLVERDVLGEYLLDEASHRVAQDPFVQSSIGNPLLSKASVRQKIKRVHLNSYFDRYDIQIYLHSSSGEPLDNLSGRTDLAEFIHQFGEGANKTSYEGIYFANRIDPSSAKRYIVIIPVTRQDRTAGYVVLSLSLKKIIPQDVYPELLVDNRFAESFRPEQFSYAIFQDTSIISSFGSYSYERDFDKSLITAPHPPVDWVQGGFRHALSLGESGRAAVITTAVYPLFYQTSNFALWTFLGIILMGFGLLIRVAFQTRPYELNYSTRITLYIFIAFIIPLIAVSATTLNWASVSAEDQLAGEFTDRTKTLAEKMAPALDDFVQEQMDGRQLEDFLIDASRLGGVDATVYSASGKLVAASQPQIFDNMILTNLVNPDALREVYSHNILFIQEEHVGKLKFNNSYSALRSAESGRLLGILSVPFFESGHSLEKSRIMILSNVLIVFIIIFVLLTVFSFIATRGLTFPLRMVTRLLRGTSLKAENKQLDWRSNDEIGWMVREYNRMVRNLEKSKIELARSQKESAWREMAQQVAHEIKNPLTPMRLTLQQMELQLYKGEWEKDRTEKAVKNLLIQLDILNEIASSFSSFAKLPAPILHRIDLTSLIDRVVLLHADHTRGNVIWKKPADPVFVLGDEQLLSRIFSNLILNGLQSGDEGQQMSVEVELRILGQAVRISFCDNGSGIDEKLKERVFIPHFTTKQSGSGLGLAISKQGIEQSGGSIWFESSPGKGSTFYISLPLLPPS